LNTDNNEKRDFQFDCAEIGYNLSNEPGKVIDNGNPFKIEVGNENERILTEIPTGDFDPEKCSPEIRSVFLNLLRNEHTEHSDAVLQSMRNRNQNNINR